MKINTRTFKDKFVTSYSNAFILRKPQLVTWHTNPYTASTWGGARQEGGGFEVHLGNIVIMRLA